MTDDRKAIIMRRVWKEAARKERASLATSLRDVLTNYDFLEEEASRELGQRFWAKANAMPVESLQPLEAVLGRLREQHADEGPVVWLHRKANVAGAILADMGELVEHCSKAREILGPDLLFANSGVSFGVCFEVDEYETILRWWG
jgi:hypothetical protein